MRLKQTPKLQIHFSMTVSFLPGAVCDALEDEQHFLTLPIDNELRVYQSGVYVEDTTSETAKTVDAIGLGVPPVQSG